MLISKNAHLDSSYAYSAKPRTGRSEVSVSSGFDPDAASDQDEKTSWTGRSNELPEPSVSVSVPKGDGSGPNARGAAMFQQATGYTMIKSSEGVTFEDADGQPPPEDKLAMLKAASTAFSTASSNGHSLHLGVDLHTDDVETSLSQIGVQAGDTDMYADLMKIMQTNLKS
ncbi:hypothetical protein [Rhizobium sp. HT1-10]|uniref:hypothetical protein n=1 Tax=Rhizobium sp. HT1-10 TaxID=3111638 RepID=UPI003C161B58